MAALCEKYRPKALAEVVGQPKAVQTVERLAKNNSLAGRDVAVKSR